MKKLILAVLCLFLAGCGTFDVSVQVFPPATPTGLPVSATAEPLSTASPAPLMPELTATPTLFSEPTLTHLGLPVGQALTLSAIYMSDANHGWGVETYGHIVKTIDGGGTWQDVTPGEGTFDSHGVAAFNQETLWAVPAQLDMSNMVWRTRDGGKTWVASQSIPLGQGRYVPLSLQFPDAKHGWLLLLVVGGAQGDHVVLYRSEDGGENWVPVSNLEEGQAQYYLPATTSTMAFFDGQTGWLGGWWGKDDPGQWMMLRTDDGGVKWGTDSLRLPAQRTVKCSGRPLAEMAPGSMAVDVTCLKGNDPKYKYHHIYYLSVNSGPAWHSWSLAGEFLSAYFLNTNQGWMMNNSADPLKNEVWYTHDGGKTWDKVSDVNWKQAQFNFVSDRIGWAVISNGYATALVRTENGGRVWIYVRPYVVEP